MTGQSLFSGREREREKKKEKKNIITLLSAELAQRVVKLKYLDYYISSVFISF